MKDYGITIFNENLFRSAEMCTGMEVFKNIKRSKEFIIAHALNIPPDWKSQEIFNSELYKSHPQVSKWREDLDLLVHIYNIHLNNWEVVRGIGTEDIYLPCKYSKSTRTEWYEDNADAIVYLMKPELPEFLLTEININKIEYEKDITRRSKFSRSIDGEGSWSADDYVRDTFNRLF